MRRSRDNHRVTNIADPLMLEDEFHFEGKLCILRVHGDVCSWSPTDDGKPESIIDLTNVLTVQGVDNDHYFLRDGEHCVRKKNKLISPSSSVTDSSHIKPCYSFEIHFVVERKSKFRVQRAVFCSRDAVVVTKWLGVLTKRLETIHTDRPKTLFVALNPYGGRKRATEVYEKRVQPLFALAGIQITLLVTERVNHAYDYILENGWQGADGIVCVGGDGTLSEVVNAVIKRTARNCELDLNDIDVPIPPPDVRIGAIPAGSTDTVFYSLHGTSDVITAAVHIIFGNSFRTDVCTVHSDEKYICSFLSLMSYGYLGDIIKNSRNLRWMGPMRYDCAGARHFICHRSYAGTVSFLRDLSQDTNTDVCFKNDCYCVTKSDEGDEANIEEKWELVRGKFFMVTAANISCSCSRSPNGIAPHSHFSDGYLDLLLIRRVTFIEKVKLLLTLSNPDKHKLVNNLDFVEIYKTRRFKFETGYGSGVIPATRTSTWNIDGELERDTHLHVRCLQDYVPNTATYG